jgi:hypothetical protein
VTAEIPALVGANDMCDTCGRKRGRTQGYLEEMSGPTAVNVFVSAWLTKVNRPAWASHLEGASSTRGTIASPSTAAEQPRAGAHVPERVWGAKRSRPPEDEAAMSLTRRSFRRRPGVRRSWWGDGPHDVIRATNPRQRIRPLRDLGMATAEYAVVTLAACGFAGLLVALLRSDAVRELLLGIIRRALSQ